MELKNIFSKRLRNARLMRGLSMQQLCVMMNDIVTKQSVSKYERGESMPDSTILIALCKALNISPDYLFRENRSALNNVHYRKLTRLSAKEEKSINLMVEDTIERINEIEDICGIERHFDASSFTCLQGHTIRSIWGFLQTMRRKKSEKIGNDSLMSSALFPKGW